MNCILLPNYILKTEVLLFLAEESSSAELEKIDHQQVIDLMRQQLVANPGDFNLGEGEGGKGQEEGWLGEGGEGGLGYGEVEWDGEGEEEGDLDECRREHLCFQVGLTTF